MTSLQLVIRLYTLIAAGAISNKPIERNLDQNGMSMLVTHTKLRGKIEEIQALVIPGEMETRKKEIKGGECVKSDSCTVLAKKKFFLNHWISCTQRLKETKSKM